MRTLAFELRPEGQRVVLTMASGRWVVAWGAVHLDSGPCTGEWDADLYAALREVLWRPATKQRRENSVQRYFWREYGEQLETAIRGVLAREDIE